jgi:hypothetical protein
MCAKQKNGLEWKFQILFLDPLPFASQSHHIPIVLLFFFACKQELHQGTTMNE